MNFNIGLNKLVKLFDPRKVVSNDDDYVGRSEYALQNRNIVFYVGGGNDAVVAAFIQEELEKLSFYFQELGCQFVFHPALQKELMNDVLSALLYHFPQWQGAEKEIYEHIQGIDSNQFYKTINEVYAQGNIQTSSFLLVRETFYENDLKIYPIDADQPLSNGISKLLSDIDGYLDSLKLKINPISQYNPIERKETEKYNAENSFEIEASRISREVAEQIQSLLKAGQNKALLNIYNTLIKQTKLYKPELFRKFTEINNSETEMSLSRLVVDTQYRIWLTDYNNLEIVMTPLPKALYLFFLKHPEGVMLHNLVDHKKELLSIYERITNSSSTFEIKKRINDMVDVRKNSLNEKCSRIKEAFVLKMADYIAENYYITGERRGVKKITLTNNLKTFNY